MLNFNLECKRVFVGGGEAAPLITGSGSMTYNPRRKKERETGEAVDAVVNRNVKAILQSVCFLFCTY